MDPLTTLHVGDCRDILSTLPAASIDLCLFDPPYPHIVRPPQPTYTESAWLDLMASILPDIRRVLTPEGSCVIVLQPTSEKVGSMRAWPWRFLVHCADTWNVVQDAYWWNHTALPTVHTARGLLRPSLKYCIWLGSPDCYRDQSTVLWEPSDATKVQDLSDRALRYTPSGAHVRSGRACAASVARGGVTPFNVLPLPNADSRSSSGARGHGSGTPVALARWWIRYLTRPGGTVLDPMCGAGSILEAAVREGRSAIGIDRDPHYINLTRDRLDKDGYNSPSTAIDGGAATSS